MPKASLDILNVYQGTWMRGLSWLRAIGEVKMKKKYEKKRDGMEVEIMFLNLMRAT